MMKNFLLILMLCMGSVAGMAQKDEKAAAILKDFSEHTKALKGMHIQFDFILDNRQENTMETQKGELYLQDNLYKLSLTEINTVKYFDGNKIWMWNKEVSEVTVEFPDEDSEEEDMLSNPSMIFDSYEKNYKFRLIGEKVVNGKNITDIELYPLDLNTGTAKIKLLIEKAKKELYSAQIFAKDGIIYTFTIKSLKGNKNWDQKFFQFDPAKNPSVEVIDLTE